MGDAEIIQLGAHGRAGRGSRATPSAAARGLASDGAGPRAPQGRRRAASPVEDETQLKDQTPFEDQTPVEDQTLPEDTEPEDSRPEGTRTEDDGASGAGTEEEAPAAEDNPLDLAHLLTELVGMGRSALAGLRQVPHDAVREFAADPLPGLLSVADGLGVDWQESLDDLAEFIRTRMSGDYAIDEFGFDPEFTERVYLPLLQPLVEKWFRVEVRGVENLPDDGSALLVSNHAGTLPLDGMVLQSVVHDATGRFVRMLGADLIFKTPYSHDLARKTGTTLACQEDAERLLASDQLVSVFPEGFKGLGKPYSERYRLQRFGRGGFVSAAVRAEVPIIPISIVGSEEIFPLLSTAPALARAMGVPYFPVTPLFPWLGVLGMIPLPSKWIIQIGDAITTDELPAGAADDPMVVFNVTDQVRETIQQTLYGLLMQRRSIFY